MRLRSVAGYRRREKKRNTKITREPNIFRQGEKNRSIATELHRTYVKNAKLSNS
jgi:hypothetical protein